MLNVFCELKIDGVVWAVDNCAGWSHLIIFSYHNNLDELINNPSDLRKNVSITNFLQSITNVDNLELLNICSQHYSAKDK